MLVPRKTGDVNRNCEKNAEKRIFWGVMNDTKPA